MIDNQFINLLSELNLPKISQKLCRRNRKTTINKKEI